MIKLNENISVSVDINKGKYIIIPLYVVNDVRLTPTDKFIFGLVYSLSQKTGYCSMGNKKISELLPATERTIKSSITKLDSLGFVKRELIRSHNNYSVVGRKLYPLSNNVCEFDKRCSVNNLTTSTSKYVSSGDTYNEHMVTKGSPNSIFYNKDKRKTSYDINELKKIDTLDFIK